MDIIMAEHQRGKKIYTVAEFAEELGVPQSSVRRWVKTGELRGTKMGKKWLIPASEIERLLNPPRKKTSS